MSIIMANHHTMPSKSYHAHQVVATPLFSNRPADSLHSSYCILQSSPFYNPTRDTLIVVTYIYYNSIIGVCTYPATYLTIQCIYVHTFFYFNSKCILCLRLAFELITIIVLSELRVAPRYSILNIKKSEDIPMWWRY